MKLLELNSELESMFVRVCDYALKNAGVNVISDVNSLWNAVKKKEEKPPESNG